MRVKAKVIPAGFLKIEKTRDVCWDERAEKEGQLYEFESDKTLSYKVPLRRKVSRTEGLPEERWRRVGVSGSLRGRRSEEMNQFVYLFPKGVRSTI